MEQIVTVLDWLGQQVAAAPVFLQVPLVLLPCLMICGVLALVLLRVIDFIGVKVAPWMQTTSPSSQTSKLRSDK